MSAKAEPDTMAEKPVISANNLTLLG